MKLDMFELQLNEERVNDKVKDITRRVKELRALNNSCDEICKKISIEFGKEYNDIKKYLLPLDLKRFVGMSTDELEKVGEKPIKELRNKYSKFKINTSSKSGFLKQLMSSYIEGK